VTREERGKGNRRSKGKEEERERDEELAPREKEWKVGASAYVIRET